MVCPDVRYMEQLASLIGPLARYQVFSVLFAGKQQKSLARSYPALAGNISGRACYSFLIPAKELLAYAHVHHRALATLSEVPGAYQRMLKAAKLRKIRNFIDKEEGFFPNSIIVNFTREPKWDPGPTYGDVAQGCLTLPPYYGSAWVIDGQHRVYGAAQAKRNLMLPVLAFKGMDVPEQASLFVEINEKQKRVPPELLWDLYPDIYDESTDESHERLRQVSLAAKLMAQRAPLAGHINIPSLPTTQNAELKLTTVCDTLRKYFPWGYATDPKGPSRAHENVARVLGAYYDELQRAWPDEWARAARGVLLSNNGFGVLVMVLGDIVRHMASRGHERLFMPAHARQLAEHLRQTYVMPLVEYLKDDERMRADIPRETGRGPQDENAAYLEWHLAERVEGFRPARLDRHKLTLAPAPAARAGPDVLREKCKSLEPIFRDHVLKSLRGHYGDRWWKQGVPSGPKDYADAKWQAETKDQPHLQHATTPAGVNEWKFSRLGLGHLKDVVVYGPNWEAIFEAQFADKDNFQRRLRDIAPLRDAESHTWDPCEQRVLDATAALYWFSNCLANRSLNPYL